MIKEEKEAIERLEKLHSRILNLKIKPVVQLFEITIKITRDVITKKGQITNGHKYMDQIEKTLENAEKHESENELG